MFKLAPLLLGLAFWGCSQEADEKAALAAAAFVTKTEPHVPFQLPDGSWLSHIAVRGDTVEMSFTGVEDWKPELNDYEARDMHSGKLCSNKMFKTLVNDGVNLKAYHLSKTDDNLPVVEISDC